MTNREKELLDLIGKNPTISQNELASALGITRSSVAVHITNLIKKGLIAGKGYILKQNDYVSVLGGSNIDIIGFPEKNLILQDSNPGKVKVSLGGVGRNIAENLVHLGVSTKLISAVGEDIYGRKIVEHATAIGLDMKSSLFMSQVPTSTYLAILDEKGDMKAAISHMDIYNEISIDFIQDKRQVIENSKLCIIDTNIPDTVINYVLDNFKNTVFFLDTVSSTKALKIKNKIGAFHTIKPNRIEAELLSGIKTVNNNDLLKASEYFLNKGVKNVFITLGKDGVFYNDGHNHKLIANPEVKVVNATGAGDAFVAALAYCHFNDYDIEHSTRFSMTAAILALSHEETINPNISQENVNKRMKEIGLC
ncbi:MAG: psuK 2 [Eubacterium sp.]|nr:psuK 2 [Eubacterium sp.]